ncbi:zinc finger protein OZF-like isoform X2 [Coccinella septempunctata]|uniref:zinc finger protein OZF-like isoform X2 n=1 Tax=Coccinella septempunctata TaxID=41139 RepID=UPI001D061C5F|nr:zinc finger protein OZF-like isoform X2 [Coccinella septempunctata]
MLNIFQKFCRCCMKDGEFNIFTTLFESHPIARILEKILSKKISSDDDFPKTICDECYKNIISHYTFVKNYVKVQEILLGILEKNRCVKANQTKNLFPHSKDSNITNEFQSSDDDQPLSSLYKHSTKKYKETNGTSSVDSLKEITSVVNENEIQKEYLILNKKIENSSIKAKETASLSQDETNDKKIESSAFKHSCVDCNESYDYIKQLEKHCKETGHIVPRRFSCVICSKKFLSKTRLKDHVRTHDKEKPFPCEDCGMAFTLSSNLKRHKKRHTGEKSYFCEVCGKGFIQKHTLTVHMRLHNGETPYVCELCGKGYRAKPLLHQHMYKHKDADTQTIKYQKYYLKYGKVKVECKVCQKIVTKSALYNHMKVQHGDGLKKFLCNLCGKTYATKMSLDVHMNIHTKKISYNCNICSKSFTHQNYLKTHLMLHSGERPHCCDLCGKTFVQRTHLDRHKRIHTGARPFTCTYCDKAFALNENLKVHIRIHTKETPHYCSECGKGFYSSSSRKKHETNVHQK